MAKVDDSPAKVEQQYHNYVGSAIPWYVRFIWILFWCFAAYYTVTYLFPNLREELFAG
ncbi:MAG: hypothetical protein R3C10_26360 [Pirellulales bacterium]|nr:hypothetical protein [Planctomycetales bacterium]